LLPVVFLHALIIFKTNEILVQKDCAPDIGIRELLGYAWWTGNANSLKDRNFCKENLSGVRLTGVALARSNFDLSNISNSIFRDSNLAYCSFQGATLANTNFGGQTILVGADFRCKSNVKGDTCSSLIETNFENAKLQMAQFQGAFMEGVIFKGANLQKADLSNVKGLTAKQLDGALLCETNLPTDLRDNSGNLISSNRDCP